MWFLYYFTKSIPEDLPSNLRDESEQCRWSSRDCKHVSSSGCTFHSNSCLKARKAASLNQKKMERTEQDGGKEMVLKYAKKKDMIKEKVMFSLLKRQRMKKYCNVKIK